MTLSSPEDNILYDEVLLQMAEGGEAGEVLRFWESPDVFIVLGRISREADDLNVSAVKKDHIPVLRRASGGGTVVQGPGCLNYSLVLSKERGGGLQDIAVSYRYIMDRVVQALQSIGVKAVFFPISDIALQGQQKKISGNAQKRLKNHILHHGTILYAFDLPLITKYLSLPQAQPDYREQRAHDVFVTNIQAELEVVKQALSKAFKAEMGAEELTFAEELCLRELREKRSVTVEL